MIKKHHVLATILSFACMSSVIHAKTAEEEGRDFGQNSIESTSSLVNSQNGQNTVPNFSTNAPESAYYQKMEWETLIVLETRKLRTAKTKI
ncbi:hypothetical protein NHY65_19515 (plasmid) [Acinetobacter baumannii]|nr:hypothetical protein NHY65_19515 [Acinetobacter baumannii]